MTLPRRRVIRPALPTTDPRTERSRQKLHSRLERERVAVTRWLTRLKRAFHAFEKCQATIARLERQLTRLERP